MTELKIAEPIERMLEQLKVETVFGQPIKEGDVTIIPVAEMGVGFGYGFGQGPSATDEEGETVDADTDADAGTGGVGGGGRSMPRGYIEITSEGVSFESIMKEGQVAMAGIMLVAWTVFWVTKTIRAFAKK